MRELVPLAELIPGYPEDEPQYGDALLEHGFAGLSDTGGEVLRHLLAAVHSHDRPAIISPMAVLAALDGSGERSLFPSRGAWKTYALDASWRPILVPTKSGTLSQSRLYSHKVPSAHRVRTEVPVPEGGSHLLVYGGGPGMLSELDGEGRCAADDLGDLWHELPLADVVFWVSPSGQAPTLHSVRVGMGDRGGEAVPFPDPIALAKARGESTTHQEVPGE